MDLYTHKEICPTLSVSCSTGKGFRPEFTIHSTKAPYVNTGGIHLTEFHWEVFRDLTKAMVVICIKHYLTRLVPVKRD